MLNQLIDVLDPTPAIDGTYRADNMHPEAFRVYGGQVLGQAISAGQKTVSEDRILHSQHAYFLRPGDPAKPIVYTVEKALDGGSFSSRRVVALQDDKPILVSTLSFQRPGLGDDFQTSAPAMPAPEELVSERELALAAGNLNESFMITTGEDIEMRMEETMDWDNPTIRPPVMRCWIRATGPVPGGLPKQQVLLAYMSDCMLIDVCMAVHGRSFRDDNIQTASLDHALWFHNPFEADEWLLHEVHAEAMSGGRGLARGSFFTRDGTLVATTMQQGLMRFRS